MRKPNPKNFNGLISGRCAHEAFAYIFRLDAIGIQRIFHLCGCIEGDGVSTVEARKAVSILCDITRKQFVYVPNLEKINYKQFHINHKHEKGIEYLINMDGHISSYKNGSFHDNFGLYYKILGWWKITRKP